MTKVADTPILSERDRPASRNGVFIPLTVEAVDLACLELVEAGLLGDETSVTPLCRLAVLSLLSRFAHDNTDHEIRAGLQSLREKIVRLP